MARKSARWPHHPISAAIARRDCHNSLASERDESSPPEPQMGFAVPCLRVVVGLRRQNRRRASGGHAAMDGWRACRRAAAAWYARIRCLDDRARPGSSEAESRAVSEDRSTKIARLTSLKVWFIWLAAHGGQWRGRKTPLN